MRYLLALILTLFFANYAIAGKNYFSVLVKGSPRVMAIVYGDEIIFQNLLNKRYVYTIPKDGNYTLDNGQRIAVKNGVITASQELKYDLLYALGVSKSNAFFNQDNQECNKLKFKVARNLLARDCNPVFHQYQMIPLFPDFIRLIVTSTEDVFVDKNCPIISNNVDELLAIEAKTDDAIIQEQSLQSQKDYGERGLNSKEASELKDAKKQIKRLKPWEFGLNDRSIILNSTPNNSELKDEKTAFYITYFNDIGCIPYKAIKLASCEEYNNYAKVFMENYLIVSEFNDIKDDQDYKIFDLSYSNVSNYTTAQSQKWKNYISECQMKDAQINGR
ncbi:hypothetical protein [Candidatus Deianiraea vastatrix]|uniref:Uncharacterized protein n=1 Tax=Candidatus Deianiraea vastatrix TaxID=2163644 RepID=A0A5B8XD78_9RICK|nr:hypothetical protein [Candidatus Deianiraea vastatrix]QED23329.1 hypothetical protein Deia_00534 [Candidatus Deianiraea vastatrix]